MAGTSSKVHMEVEYLVLGRLAVVGEQEGDISPRMFLGGSSPLFPNQVF